MDLKAMVSFCELIWSKGYCIWNMNNDLDTPWLSSILLSRHGSKQGFHALNKTFSLILAHTQKIWFIAFYPYFKVKNMSEIQNASFTLCIPAKKRKLKSCVLRMSMNIHSCKSQAGEKNCMLHLYLLKWNEMEWNKITLVKPVHIWSSCRPTAKVKAALH